MYVEQYTLCVRLNTQNVYLCAKVMNCDSKEISGIVLAYTS